MRACFCLLIPLLLVVIALLQCATATEKAQTNSSKGGGAKAKDAQPKASTHADTKKPSEKADHSKKETEKDGVQNAPPAAGKEHAGKSVHGHDKTQHEKINEKKGSRSTSPHGKRDPSPSRSGNRDNHGADGHTGKVGHDHGHGHESPEDKKNKKKGTSHSSGGGSSPTVGSPRADGSKKVQPTENGKHYQAEKDGLQPPSPTAAATAGHNRHVGPHKSGNGVAPPPPAVEKQAAPTFEAPSVPSPGDDGDNGGGFGGLEPSSGGGSQFGDELDDLPTGAGAEMDFGQDGVNDSLMPNSRARRTSLGDADEPAERAQVGFGDDADGDVAVAGMNKMDNYGLDDDDAKSEGADADPFNKEAGGPQEDGNEAGQFKDPIENADDDGMMMKKKGEVAMDD